MERLNLAQSSMLNLAAFKPVTTALGPGRRAALWVQGCPFHCRGCIAPEWIPQRPAQQVSVTTVASWLANIANLRGLTLSGGEPMLQAAALAALVRSVRQARAIDVICFTGYLLDDLRRNPPNPGVAALLEEVDLLIDGPYMAELNDDRGLRGSSNQQFHYLTPRLMNCGLEAQPRRVELNVQEGSVFLSGVPSRGVLGAFNQAMDAVRVPFAE